MYTNLIENFLTIEECNFIINQYKFNSQPVFNSINVIERRCTFVESIQFDIENKIINKLNEEYDGGDFYYLLNDVEIMLPKKQGSIFIFDSNILHGVKKLTDGKRYSLNCWPK